MKLGFYTNYEKSTVEFAHKVGFRSMELSALPESSLNADHVTDRQIAEVKQDLTEHGIEISALGYYPNYLDPDSAKAVEASRYFFKVMELATRMGVGVVCTFAGRSPQKSVKENIPLFKEAFSPFCDEAEKRGLRIAIENCPMLDRFYLRGENIAFSPEVWDEMFKVVPSKTLGIELDPSHMVWLGIDYVQSIYDYGKRIFHIHAKDMEINHKALDRIGILGQCFGETVGLGHGWWRARTPGWGEVDWPKFLTALLEVNYSGNIDIEHEDDVFAMANALGKVESESGIVESYGREEKGLILGFNTLSKLIPAED
jgi:sugar phosphate isomerase/epimerase